MNKNPVVPYLLIFALGIGLIFFMSLYGLDQKKEIAGSDEEGKTEETEGTANTGEFDAEAVAQQKCVSCHGDNLSGGMGPALAGSSFSEEEMHDAIKNGVPGTAMPAGLVEDDHIDEMVEYILSLE